MNHDIRDESGRSTLVKRLLERMDSWLFTAEDERAHARGWQVGRRSNGRGRTYRDPRWDSVSRCEFCAGLGMAGCLTCGGSGVVQMEPPTAMETTAPRHWAGGRS